MVMGLSDGSTFTVGVQALVIVTIVSIRGKAPLESLECGAVFNILFPLRFGVACVSLCVVCSVLLRMCTLHTTLVRSIAYVCWDLSSM